MTFGEIWAKIVNGPSCLTGVFATSAVSGGASERFSAVLNLFFGQFSVNLSDEMKTILEALKTTIRLSWAVWACRNNRKIQQSTNKTKKMHTKQTKL